MRIGGWTQLFLLGAMLWLASDHEAHSRLHAHGGEHSHCAGGDHAQDSDDPEGCVIDLFAHGKLSFEAHHPSRYSVTLSEALGVKPAELQFQYPPPSYLSPFTCGPPRCRLVSTIYS